MRKALFLLLIAVFFLAVTTAAIAAEATRPHTRQALRPATSAPTSQPTPQQKRSLKIPKKRFLYLPTEPELKDLMSQMHGKYDAFKTCSLRLMDDFHQYNYRLSLCSNKSYSYEEQQAAGCLPNDTTQQCSDKLLKVCIRQPALALKDSSAKVQSTLQALITKSTEFTNRLRALSDQLSDQLQERH